MPESDSEATPLPPLDEPAARSERIAAMLARWQSEDLADEPEWDVDDVQRVRLGGDGLRAGDET